MAPHQAAGVARIQDCRRGGCSLCALRLLETGGPVGHRDTVPNDEETAANGKRCAGVSCLPVGLLVIDTTGEAG